MRNRNTIEQEVRDLLQPVLANLYLLQTSPTLTDPDRLPLADMDASCQEVARVLRATIDQALDEESENGRAR